MAMNGPFLAAALAAVLLMAGCTEPEAPAPLPEPLPPPVPVAEAVDWTGLLGSGLCFRGGAVVTVSAGGLSGPAAVDPTAQSDFPAGYLHEAPDGHNLAGGHLQLSWDATAIVTEGLRVAVWVVEDCPGDCEVNRTLFSTAARSPIEIPVDAFDLREDMAIAVAVSPADTTQGTSASVGQEFRLAGTLSFVEDVDGDPEPEDEDEEDDD
jgi:hypothetical protein